MRRRDRWQRWGKNSRGRRCGSLPTESFAHAVSYLVGAIRFGYLDVADAGFAQRFFLDRIPACCVALIMAATLVFYGRKRPALSINDEKVDSFAIDRVKRIRVRR